MIKKFSVEADLEDNLNPKNDTILNQSQSLNLSHNSNEESTRKI